MVQDHAYRVILTILELVGLDAIVQVVVDESVYLGSVSFELRTTMSGDIIPSLGLR